MSEKQQTALQTLIAWGDERMKQEPMKLLSFAEAIDKAEELLAIEREQMINAQMDMFLHINETPYGLQYLNQREEAYDFAEQYFTDTYKTEP